MELPLRHEPLVEHVAKRRSVVEALAPRLGAGRVEVRVDVDDRDGTVARGDGAQRGRAME